MAYSEGSYLYGDEDEVELSPEEQERIQILDEFGLKLSATRSEAIKGRLNMGVEDTWREDEEYYEGTDDVNRGQSNAMDGKPAGQAAIKDDEDTGSTVFVNITAPYCDAASARVGDMLLPTDDRGWAISNTPIPELIGLVEGKPTPEIDRQILEASGGDGAQAAETRDKMVAMEKTKMAEAVEKAKRAEKRIEDWHVEGQYHAEMRLIIEDAAKVGTGVLKGPIPANRKTIAFIDGAIVLEEVIKPVSLRVDYHNCFPDPSCGSNIHNGSYHWERDDINPKQLMKLMGTSYIDAQIETVLREGPMLAIKEYSESEDASDRYGVTVNKNDNMFEIWYYYGAISKRDLEASGCECPDDMPGLVDGHITMVNNRVIKASINHLDTGEFPYDYMVWKKRRGMPWGSGVARSIRVPQDIVNGATRNMMDNAGIAGGPMWVYTDGMIEPEDGNYVLAPRKGWRRSEDSVSSNDKANFKPFEFLIVPMIQPELKAIIDMGMQLAEDVTGMPMLLQGQSGNAPDTVGGMQIVNNNASTVMRRIARLFDDLITEPHVRRYYQYLLSYGEDNEKGEFVIDARGSSALVERDLQNQSIMNMGQLVLNPVYGKDPKKWMDEFLKSQRLDPARFDYDDDQWKQIVEGMAQANQGPPDSRLEVAQLKAESDNAKLAADTDIANRTLEVEIEFKAMQQEIELMKLQQDGNISANQIKARIGELVIKLKSQEKLSGFKATGEQALKPAAEPAGKAPDGESFTK